MTKFNGKKVISMLWFLGAIWGIVLFPRSLVSLWAALVGYGLFVAVAQTGTGNRVMTSTP